MVMNWYLCPYKERHSGRGKVKYCAMDDYTQEIKKNNGDWAEMELTNRRALVLLDSDLDFSKTFKRLSETEALSARRVSAGHTPFRSLFRILERPQSREVAQLLSLWLGVGFGKGFRIPRDACAKLARLGLAPNDIKGRDIPVLLRAGISMPILGAAFGDSSSTLDNFNRADENPLSGGGNWATFSDVNNLKIVSNICEATDTFGRQNWAAASFGPDTEVFTTIARSGIGDILIMVRLQGTIGAWSTTNGYMYTWDNSNRHRIHRLDDSDFKTQVGSTVTQTYAVSESYGLEIIGSTLQMYRNAGSWAALGSSGSDSTYSAAGRVGLLVEDSSVAADDFSAGTISAGGISIPVLSNAYFMRRTDF